MGSGPSHLTKDQTGRDTSCQPYLGPLSPRTPHWRCRVVGSKEQATIIQAVSMVWADQSK